MGAGRRVFKNIWDWANEESIPVRDYWNSGEYLRQMSAPINGLPKSEGFGAWMKDSNPLPWPFTDSAVTRRDRNRDLYREAWDDVMRELLGDYDDVSRYNEPIVDTVSRAINDPNLTSEQLTANHRLIKDAIKNDVTPLAAKKIKSQGRRNAAVKAVGYPVAAGLFDYIFDEENK